MEVGAGRGRAGRWVVGLALHRAGGRSLLVDRPGRLLKAHWRHKRGAAPSRSGAPALSHGGRVIRAARLRIRSVREAVALAALGDVLAAKTAALPVGRPLEDKPKSLSLGIALTG
jgi:hypothetical protein